MFDLKPIADAAAKASRGLQKAFAVWITYQAQREERAFYDRCVANLIAVPSTDVFRGVIHERERAAKYSLAQVDTEAAACLLLRQERFGTADVIAREALHGLDGPGEY